MKRQKSYFFAFCMTVVLMVSGLEAAETPAPKAASDPTAASSASSTHESLTKQAIREQVRVLRQERAETMPYLDRGYIRYEINGNFVRQKTEFVSGGKKELKDLIARALRVHTPARASKERISLARRRILAAWRKLFPETKFEIHKKGGNLSQEPYNSRNYKFSFRQPVFHGGILWNTLLKEKAGLEAAQKEYDKTLSDLIYDVSSAYFEYNRTRLVIEDQKKGIEKMRHFSEISQRKFKEEIISEIEHLNVQSLFSQMEYDYETSKQELEIAKLEMDKFLNLTSHDEIDVLGFYDLEALVEKEKSNRAADVAVAPTPQTEGYQFEGALQVPDLGTLVDLAYESRPELRIEASKLQSARLEERIQMGEMIPSADAVLEFGKLGEAFDANSTRPGLRNEFRFMIEVNWNAAGNKMNYTYEKNAQPPSVSQFLQGSGSETNRNSFSVGLWDGLDQWASMKEAEVAKLDQIVELEKAEKEVIQDVKQAYFDFQKAQIQVKSSLQRVDYRKRLTQLAEHRLSQNEVQISEYFQTEIDLLREQTELHKALKDYFSAKAKLNHAIGKEDLLPMEAVHGK
ncbi:MAG: TolC family protein [Candidatus Omnitrophica bacterium]|nr:TolC family protein [Candidatus Omnitrophota bacterium]